MPNENSEQIRKIVLDVVRDYRTEHEFDVRQLVAAHAELGPKLEQKLLAAKRVLRARDKVNREQSSNLTVSLSSPYEGGESHGLRPADKAGLVGPYRILGKLGEGGFGIVYLAEQTEPVKRRVALKVIKPGMDSNAIIARFEAERQALALMNHPNVAKVFDGGTTESGHPYFFMELVEGVRITEHCDRQNLTIEKRLNLFIDVCHAVQHAHQKGVIHRDLKPSNILVEVVGDKAIPKVIDFGVAKAISQSLTDETLYTAQGQLIGTPDYMSPEQVDFTSQDIDTRSDIYALGVLLYELLTGALPFDSKTMREVGLGEVCRIIREVDPPKPSTRLKSQINFDRTDATMIARLRGVDPNSLSRMLRGELDWIIMKAIEKDRQRRYATASDLASDIQRHLKHEPVSAGPPSTGYRVRKFVQRNRVGVGAFVLVMATLLVGVTGTSLGFIEASRERQLALESAEEAEHAAEKARTASDTANEINSFMTDMVAKANPFKSGRDVTVLEAIRESASDIDAEFTNRPAVQAGLHEAVASSYLGLGLYDEAEGHFSRALSIKRSILDSSAPELATTLEGLAQLHYYAASDFTKAEKLWTEAARIRGGATDLGAELAHAEQIFERGAIKSASRKFEDVLDRLRKLDANHDLLGACVHARAYVLNFLGDSETAEAWYRWVRDRDEEKSSLFFSICTNNLGMALLYQRFPEVASEFIHDAAKIRTKLEGAESRGMANSLDAQAYLHLLRGELGLARADYEKALEMKCRLFKPTRHLAVAFTQISLATVALELGDERVADDLIEEASKSFARNDHPYLPRIHFFDRARLHHARDDLNGADTLFQEALRLFRLRQDRDDVFVAMTLCGLGRLYRDMKRLDEGAAHYQRAIAIQKELLGDSSPIIASSLLALADLHLAAAKYAEAEPLFREAIERRERIWPPAQWLTARARMRLAVCLAHLQRCDEAATLAKESVAVLRRELGTADPRTAEAIETATRIQQLSTRIE